MALINVALYCSKADIKVPVVGGVGGGGANRFSCQTHNQVTLGCFWVGLLLLCLVWGYDNRQIIYDFSCDSDSANCHNPKAKPSNSNPTQKQPKVTWLWV